jgi:hypothetical protein
MRPVATVDRELDHAGHDANSTTGAITIVSGGVCEDNIIESCQVGLSLGAGVSSTAGAEN